MFISVFFKGQSGNNVLLEADELENGPRDEEIDLSAVAFPLLKLCHH